MQLFCSPRQVRYGDEGSYMQVQVPFDIFSTKGWSSNGQSSWLRGYYGVQRFIRVGQVYL